MEAKKKIGVIGAGISGLSCAYELQKAGFDVTVYEKEATPGGRMNSRTQNGFVFDTGADHLCNLYDTMKAYCNEFHIVWQKMAFNEYGVIKKGKIIRLVDAVGRFSQFRLVVQYFLTKNVGDFFFLNDAVKYDTDNARDFMLRRTGKEVVDYLVDPFVSTYQFHRSNEISLGALYGIMNSVAKDKTKWDLHRTRGGMKALPLAFAEKVHVRFRDPIKSILGGDTVVVQARDEQSYDAVVCSSPATVTNRIYSNPTEAQKTVLENTRYATTMSVVFRVPKASLPNVSIVWVPYVENTAISGFVNESMKGDECIQDGTTLLSTWLHEDFAKQIFNLSDAEVYERVREELAKVCTWVARKEDFVPHDLERWEDAMPVFAHGHLSRVKTFLEHGQGGNNVYFCGDYLNSPWTEGALRSGVRTAQTIIDRFAE
ncbi:MAG: FAD-dependent oxidoreductase [bacterium]|nr:FAD-dependent oxidoreductase [bacterium]